ncbi:unnamed protein product [Symbiodinium sp. CCMP2592]|nr:unnamed protein product [Symbiodinium sp. CCMP2592]
MEYKDGSLSSLAPSCHLHLSAPPGVHHGGSHQFPRADICPLQYVRPVAGTTSPIASPSVPQKPRTFSLLSLQLAAHVAVFPPEMDRWELCAKPLTEFGWSGLAATSGATEQAPTARHYVLFDSDQHMRLRPLGPTWTVDIVAATQRDADVTAEAIPLDLRGLTGSICTGYLRSGLLFADVVAAYSEHCPAYMCPAGLFDVVDPNGAQFAQCPRTWRTWTLSGQLHWMQKV